ETARRVRAPLSLKPISLQVAQQEVTDVIAVDEFERPLAQRIVAAGQRDALVIQLRFASLGHHLFREVRRERGVVAGVDEQRLLLQPAITLPVHRWADGEPGLPPSVEIDVLFEPLADLARG